MYRWSVMKMLFPWVMLLLVASCGTTTDYAGGGIGGTGISVGRITGFGSVWVNGVEYFTAGAIISMDGVVSTSDGSLNFDKGLLDEGRIVNVHWKKDASGVPFALRIEFRDNLEGAVTDIDPLNQTIYVMGQSVAVDAATVFENSRTDTKVYGDIDAILESISVGDIIEVSGFSDVKGLIHATFIELESTVFTPGVTEVGIKGYISNLVVAQGACKFNIGSLIVDCGNARELPQGGLSNDIYVEAEGTLDGSGLVLSAEKVELEDDIFEETGGMGIEIEGMVTAAADVNGLFEVNRRQVRIVGGVTIFEDGATAADIIPGAEIEVEGTMDEHGVLVADKIEIETD